MENEEKQPMSSEVDPMKESLYSEEAIRAGALTCHYHGRDSKVLQAKLQQQADRISVEQAEQQGDETPTKRLLTMTWVLILGSVVSFFVSKELFYAIFVCSVYILQIFAIALVKSKNAIARVTGAIIIAIFGVLYVSVCYGVLFLGGE